MSRKIEFPVRQLSLQQQPVVPRRQRMIRRQRSVEDERSLRVHANPITRAGLCANVKTNLEKPKVRVAWGETRRADENVGPVEVVARQIPGRSRPSTGRPRANHAFSNDEKAMILYTRQELAERLRLVWKHRQENRANIDIFLANEPLSERCDTGSTCSDARTTAPSTPFSKREPHLELQPLGARNYDLRNSGNNVIQNQEMKRDKTFQEMKRVIFSDSDKTNDLSRSQTIFDPTVTLETNKILVENITKTNIVGVEKLDLEIERVKIESKETTCSSPAEVVKIDEKSGESIFQWTETNVDVKNETAMPVCAVETRIQIPTTTQSNSIEESSECVKPPIVENEKNSSREEKESTDQASRAKTKTFEETAKTAKERRACFQSGTNKAFLVPIRTNSNLSRGPSEIKSEGTLRPTKSAPIRRVPSSAGRTRVDIVIDTPGSPNSVKTKDDLAKNPETEDQSSRIKPEVENPSKIVTRERAVKSAPIKKRSRSGKRRSLTGEQSIKDDEVGTKSRSRVCVVRGKSSSDSKTGDVVTMVSLVSSAESGSEDENSPNDDKLINELRSRLPTTPIIKNSASGSLRTIRKPFKSVSFQSNSFDKEDVIVRERSFVELTRQERSNTDTSLAVLFSRTVSESANVADTYGTENALPILSFLQDEKPEVSVCLMDREKRCLAVPIGDVYDKKRKLLKIRSANPPSESDGEILLIDNKEQFTRQTKIIQNEVSTLSTSCSVTETGMKEPGAIKDLEIKVIPTEPNFQTNKEKECWHLYRRMCDKGVYVSFDTILRGMLTPTEYRLRQKSFSQEM